MKPSAPGGMWRAERAKAARRHHPDVGGDLHEYLRVTAEIDRRHGHGSNSAGHRPASDPGCHLSARKGWRARARRRLGALARRSRALSKTTRSTVPRWVPGARRYTQI